jgi:hypothetical protein
MKNIQLSTDKHWIEAARARACPEQTTLNDQFRIRLKDYAQRGRKADQAMELVDRMRGYVRLGERMPTRGQMNER